MKVAVLIQARSRSTRLPGKCFLPIAYGHSEGGPDGTALYPEVSIIERVFSQVARSKIPAYFVIPEDDERLGQHLLGKRLPFFTGPEDDVRARYRLAAARLELDMIVRATADNPFTDPEHIVLSLNRMIEAGADLFSFTDLPLGVGVEIFTTQALTAEIADEKGIHREHVSLHIKHNPERFSVLHEPSPIVKSWREQRQYNGSLPRLTVDERRDYDTVFAVAERLKNDSITGLLDLFLAEPGLFEGNRDVEQLRFDRG